MKKFKRKIPVAPLMGFPATQLSGTRIKENLEDADTQFQSLNLLYQRFNPDAAFIMMDLSVEAEALGLRILKPENASYTVKEHPIKNVDDLRRLSVPSRKNNGRISLMAKVMSRMKSEFDCPNVGYVIGPFTLTGLLSGATNVMESVLINPNFLRETLSFSNKVIDYYASSLIEAGADMICILEPTVTVLSPKQFREFSGEYVKELKKKWSLPTILHICGDSTVLVPEMVNTGCNGISLDSMVDLGRIKELVPEEILIIGNINPVNTLAYGKKDDVKKAVKELLKAMEGRDNFVLSSGCDLPADTNLTNIDEMFKVVEDLC